MSLFEKRAIAIGIMLLAASVANGAALFAADDPPVPTPPPAAAVETETPADKKPANSHDSDDHAKAGHASDAGGHGQHNPHDLSEGNAGPGLLSPEDLRFDLSIYTAIVFFLLLVILWKFAWGPISQGLEHREKSILGKIEEARASAEKAAEQLRSYEARLAAAADEAREIVAGARRDAEAAKDRILAEAQQLSQRERERAVEDINAAKNVALREIAQRSVNTAVSLAGRIIRKEVKPQDHAQLIREALEQFPSKN